MDLFSLAATLTLNSEGFNSALADAEKKGKDAEGSFSKIGQAVKNAFNFAAIATTMGGALNQIAKDGKAFDTAIGKVSTIADTSKKSIGELKDSILTLSTETGIAATELSETVYQAISGGVDTADAVAAAGTAAKLAKGGFTDSATAIDVLTTATNAYNGAAGTMEHISDVLITTQNLGKTSVGELAASMGKVIPTAASYGVSLENVSAAYALMTAAGVNTAQSTTNMNAMLLELGDSGSTVSKVLQEKTGKSFKDLMEDGASLDTVMGILKDSVDGDTVAFNELWSSSSAGAAAMTLANAEAGKFDETLQAMQESAGATETAYATMSQTIEEKQNRLTNTFTAFGQSLYTSVSPLISKGLDLITAPLGDFLTSAAKGFDDLMKGIGKIGDAIGKSIEAGDVQPIKDLITDTFGEGSEITNALNATLDLGSSIFSGIKESFEKGDTQPIKDVFADLFGENSSAYTWISGIIDFASGIITTVQTALEAPDPISAIQGIFDGLFGDEGVVPQAIQNAIELGGKILTDIFGFLQGDGESNSGIQQIFDTLFGVAGDIATTITNGVVTVGSNIIAAIYSGITGDNKSGSDIVAWFDEKIVQPISGFIGDIVAAGGNIIQGIKDAFDKATATASAIVNWVDTNIITPIKVFFNGIASVVNPILETVQKIFGFNGKTVTVYTNEVKTVTYKYNQRDNDYYKFIAAGGNDDAWKAMGHEVPEHATGLEYVPYDDYFARLHEGERVLTKAENAVYSKNEATGGGVEIDYGALAQAVASALSGIVVNMDGETVGNLVADSVSRNIANRASALRYAR